MRKILSGVALGAVLAVAAHAAQAQDVKIGFLATFSGPAAALGQEGYVADELESGVALTTRLAGHALTVLQHCVAHAAERTAELPQTWPECRRLRHRPAP